MMIESILLLALFYGLVSALSLPLGALTTLFWSPSDKSMAWLMAFGAGALLSAVTIDLLAPSITKGLFVPVAIGAIIGSLFYLMLNYQLNQKGGFLRKTATLIQYVRHQHTQHQNLLSQSINRLDFFDALNDEDKAKLLNLFTLKHVASQEVIFHHGDPINCFYIIRQGQVKLRKPDMGLKVVEELNELDAFAHFSFLTAKKSALLAQASEPCTLWVLDKKAFNQLLQNSPSFFAQFFHYLNTTDQLQWYLQHTQKLSAQAAQTQQSFVVTLLQSEKRLAYTRETRGNEQLAVNCLQLSRRFALMVNHSRPMNEAIASKLKWRTLPKGDTLFAAHSQASRLYLLHEGVVELNTPKTKALKNEELKPGDFFGGMAFVTGGRHTSTAVAQTDIGFWILEKADFKQLVLTIPLLHEQLSHFLTQNDLQHYLERFQQLSHQRAENWTKKTVKQLVPGNMPILEHTQDSVYQHKAAYLAIWLGIFLDGIPESLMIGSHVGHGQIISISLIAGLFLSNYPEALSSSAAMREQGIRFSRIIGAWISLMLLTGLGAAFGAMWFAQASTQDLALISGIAAGAMLTVIAETMLPEAYAKGGSVIGFVTLLGFLSAIAFKGFD